MARQRDYCKESTSDSGHSSSFSEDVDKFLTMVYIYSQLLLSCGIMSANLYYTQSLNELRHKGRSASVK